MMQIFDELTFSTTLSDNVGGFSNVVMGTNKDHVIGAFEKFLDRLYFRIGGGLMGT